MSYTEIDLSTNPQTEPPMSPPETGPVQGHEAFVNPIGADAMVATPTGYELANDIGVLSQQAQAGYTSLSEQDLELLRLRVETLVKQLVAQGASDAEIQQAVGNLPISPDLHEIAQNIAQQQLDAEKFNLFSARNDGPAQEPNALQANVMTGILGAAGAAVVAEQEEQEAAVLPNFVLVGSAPRGQGYQELISPREDARSFGDQLAALGDQFPSQNTPGQQRSQDIGRFA